MASTILTRPGPSSWLGPKRFQTCAIGFRSRASTTTDMRIGPEVAWRACRGVRLCDGPACALALGTHDPGVVDLPEAMLSHSIRQQALQALVLPQKGLVLKFLVPLPHL